MPVNRHDPDVFGRADFKFLSLMSFGFIVSYNSIALFVSMDPPYPAFPGAGRWAEKSKANQKKR